MLEQSPSSHYLHHRNLKKLCSFIITERCILDLRSISFLVVRICFFLIFFRESGLCEVKVGIRD